MLNLIKALKFRLPVTKSPAFLKYFKEKYYTSDPHHLIGRKTTDYLLVPLTRGEHQNRHRKPCDYFLDDLIKSLGILFEYILVLEEQHLGGQMVELPDITIKKETIKKLRKLGLINEIQLRNYYIKSEFNRMLKETPDKLIKDIIGVIADKLSMDFHSVQGIVYQKLNRKVPLNTLPDDLAF